MKRLVASQKRGVADLKRLVSDLKGHVSSQKRLKAGVLFLAENKVSLQAGCFSHAAGKEQTSCKQQGRKIFRPCIKHMLGSAILMQEGLPQHRFRRMIP
jgi:hypothetical protein